MLNAVTTNGRDRARTMLLVASATSFAAAWFLPVARDPFPIPDAPRVEPTGYDAFRFAWAILSDTEAMPGEPAWQRALLGCTCLTSFVLVLAFALAAIGRARRRTGFALLVCAVADSSWIWLVDASPFELYRIGFWSWLLAFVLAGAALLRRGPTAP